MEKFADQYSYFSSGDLFRALTSTDNAIGNYLTDRLASGKLIDDKVTNALFEVYFYTVLDEQKAMLLDGYPRNLQQLEWLLNLCREHKISMTAIRFVLPEEIAIERMKGRGRNDDVDESIQKRLTRYYEIVEPMIERCSQVMEVIDVDATPDVVTIHQEVMKIVSA